MLPHVSEVCNIAKTNWICSVFSGVELFVSDEYGNLQDVCMQHCRNIFLFSNEHILSEQTGDIILIPLIAFNFLRKPIKHLCSYDKRKEQMQIIKTIKVDTLDKPFKDLRQLIECRVETNSWKLITYFQRRQWPKKNLLLSTVFEGLQKFK